MKGITFFEVGHSFSNFQNELNVQPGLEGLI